MAQPVNTFDSYDQVGIREDLSDMIYNISPEETPFYTSVQKTKATNRGHEWQTDALAAAQDNAHIEGDDTIAEAIVPTVRLSNQTQIFKKAVTVSDTDEGLNKAGRAREMAYQITKKTKELKRDIETAMFANQARVVGSNVVARRMAGAPAWLATNTRNVGGGGSDPTGDGSNARTDGAQVAFGQTQFDLLMQDIWNEGGKPDKVFLSSFQMNLALGFTGNNNSRANVDGEDAKVIKNMVLYVTPWGTVEWVLSRYNRPRDVFVMQSDMWAAATLRPAKTTELAKTGDNEKRQIVTELTLVCKNEKASGIVADCTTS
jgi:hypothetical protein